MENTFFYNLYKTYKLAFYSVSLLLNYISITGNIDNHVFILYTIK